MAINRTSPKKGKVVDIPTAPTIGTATAGGESATVAFTAATIGGPVTTYTALSSPGSVTETGSSSPITVSGLTAGTSYTFTVRGANSTGNGEYSSASNSVTPTVATSFESIATVTLSSASSITFSSIPSTYKHLQLRSFTKTSASGAPYAMQIRFNGDSGSNYAYHRLIGSGSAVSALATTGATQASLNYMPTPAETSVFAGGVVDILDYTNTNKYTVHRTLGGYDANGSGYVTFFSGVWLNTAAVTSITVVSESGTNLAIGSTIALYGIKG